MIASHLQSSNYPENVKFYQFCDQWIIIKLKQCHFIFERPAENVCYRMLFTKLGDVPDLYFRFTMGFIRELKVTLLDFSL